MFIGESFLLHDGIGRVIAISYICKVCEGEITQLIDHCSHSDDRLPFEEREVGIVKEVCLLCS
jgi:hypothetical protein